MDELSILVTIPIGAESFEKIRAVSPRVRLLDASDLARAERRGDPAVKEKLDAMLAQADVIYGLRIPQNAVARAPHLKWVQVMSAGVDWVDADVWESQVVLTNVSGIHATPIAEFVLGEMLQFVKLAPLCFQMKQQKEWRRLSPGVLRDKAVGIIGLGAIGREVARLAKAFRMRVVATRRSPPTPARYVDVVLSRDRLPELLAQSDFVVLALPFTPETRQIIGERELRAMKPTAYLINIGRGALIEEPALIRALKEGRIAGAGLDVYSTEPLPADSPFWALPNVIFSPHIAGGMEDYNLHATQVFCENLRRYLDGRRLLNVVNKEKRY